MAPTLASCRESQDEPVNMARSFVRTNVASVDAIIHRTMSYDNALLSGSRTLSQNMAGPLGNKPKPIAKRLSISKKAWRFSRSWDSRLLTLAYRYRPHALLAVQSPQVIPIRASSGEIRARHAGTFSLTTRVDNSVPLDCNLCGRLAFFIHPNILAYATGGLAYAKQARAPSALPTASARYMDGTTPIGLILLQPMSRK